MRVTMLTVGSRGDVQPFIAFGRALTAAGHEVRLATYPRFSEMVTGQDLAFAPLAEGQLSRGAETAAGRRWIERDSNRLPTWVGFLRDARSVATRRLADAATASADAEALVASNLAMVLGWQMASHRGIPLIRVFIGPPAWMLSTRPAPRAAPVVRQLAWLGARPWMNRVRRRSLGLSALPWREPFTALDREGMPALYAFSAALLPEGSPLRGRHEVTGFWFADRDVDPDPPAQLRKFLMTGPPPVSIGFSTMIDADPAARTRLAVDALSKAGMRGVLQGPAEAGLGAALPDGVVAVGEVSHTWLFPQCTTVVHHGAIGTTAAALRAGVPAVVIPHMTDQFLWARRLHELGVSPAPIPRRELTAQRLAEAIRCAATDPEMRARARALGAEISAVNGVAHAVEAFERGIGERVAPTPHRPVTPIPL